MRVDLGILSSDGIRQAVDAELSAPPRLLPPSLIHPALHIRQGEVATWAMGQLGGNFVPTPAEVVAVSKGNHGIRSVAIWDLPSRLLYQALASELAVDLPKLERGRGSWRAFLMKPLEFDGEYVVTSDIAACYDNIDHGLLATELLVQTGRHQVVETLTNLLRDASGKLYGIPQQSRASDVLAEAFLGQMERALVRRGLCVARYNDDFRFTCSSWSEVVRSLEVLSEEARLRGLTVNDVKTVTWRRRTYAAHLEKVATIREAIAQEARFDLTHYEEHEYFYVEREPSDSEVDRLAAQRLIERWASVAGKGRVASRNEATHRALVELLPAALATLGSDTAPPDAATLDRCVKLLRFERTLTPAVARYFTTLREESDLLRAFDALLKSKAYLNGWQVWWLQQPLSRLDGFAKGQGAKRRVEWAKKMLASAENAAVLRAPIAFTLARHGQIKTDEVLGMYDRSSSTVRPTYVAAAAMLSPTADIARALRGENKLQEWVYDWAVMGA